MANHSDNQGSGNQYGPLIIEIKKSLDTHLREMISKMFIDADELLFEKADNAASNEERTHFFDLMRDLRESKPAITVDFLENIKPKLRPFAVTQAEKTRQKSDSEGELSLVGQDEMEDMVLIKSMSGSANGWFREAISHLEARLEHLALKTPDIFAKDAISPLNICQAFDDALADQFSMDDKKLLFKMFNDKVLTKLDSIYDVINNLLIEAGVLPQIKLHALKSKSRRKQDQPQQPAEEAQHFDEDTEGPINQGGYAMTATPGHTHQGAGQRGTGSQAGAGVYPHQPAGDSGAPGAGGAAAGHAGGEAGGAGAQGAGGAAAGHAGGEAGGAGAPGAAGGMAADAGGDSEAQAGGGADAGADYQHDTAGMPASTVSQSIGNYLGVPLKPGAKPGEEGPAFPASTPQYYGHQEILEALSGIQIKPEFSDTTAEGELTFDSEAIKRAVLEQISSTSGGLVTKRINRIAEKTIDFIELIFDAIIDDTDISDTIKALLLRLQIPIIKASMMDQEFFIYDDHPARVLLDRITEVGIGVTEHSDEVYIFLNGVITKIVNEFELQTSTFQEALNEINAYVEERDAVAQAREEEAQRQVLREHARSTVLKALRDITRGKTLPEPIHPLVLKRWPTLMFNHYLNHGKENDEWITIIEVLRSIIESVQPLTSAEELLELQLNRDKLIDTTLEYLNRSSQSKEDIDKVIQGLKDVHQAHVDSADFSREEQEQAAQEASARQQQQETAAPVTEPEAAAEAEAVAEEEPEALPELPHNIMPGMWFQVYMGEDQIARRCKLSVIIVQDSKLVFVNYQGEIIVEKNIEEFSEELDNGMSKLIMGHSVFDHALNRVITGMQD